MSHRSPVLRRIVQTLRAAQFCERRGVSTAAGLQILAAGEREAARAKAAQGAGGGLSRRNFLAATGTMAAAACAVPVEERLGVRGDGVTLGADIGIVGAGFAGLVCADGLQKYGISATLHEASERVGGRCWSLGGDHPGPVEFPGQVVERGGELIDNLHKTLLGYANEFGLLKEDYVKAPGEERFFFYDQLQDEEAVVEEYRQLVEVMRADLNVLGAPTADSFTPEDEALDFTSLADYLDSRGAGPVIKAALDVAYTIEYGLDASQQSCLNLLLFMHADKRSRFQPFGVFSDERYHIVGGNESIVKGIAERQTGPILLGRRLVRARKLADGRIELTFKEGKKTVTATHDAVVFAVPFSVLRDVELDESLGLPEYKRYAIDNLVYGTNAKLMVGFDGRPWAEQGSNGVAYTDLPYLQNSWETNAASASDEHAVLTDYTGGNLGASLSPKNAQADAARFLDNLDRVYPGAAARASRVGSKLLVHMEHWPSSPFTKGSYTCNHPGYFTTIADNEQKPVDNLYFAGEHTSSFYEWQGFMEGAALSGLRAADEIWRDFR
jgi:monoamine oxidase